MAQPGIRDPMHHLWTMPFNQRYINEHNTGGNKANRHLINENAHRIPSVGQESKTLNTLVNMKSVYFGLHDQVILIRLYYFVLIRPAFEYIPGSAKYSALPYPLVLVFQKPQWHHALLNGD
jgi:hypothetical protein